jgi:hypothetical protein
MRNDPELALEPELGAGERLIWSGQPWRGVCLRASDAVFIPVSLLGLVFAIVWTDMVMLAINKSRGGVTILFALFGVPIVITAIYLVIGRFAADAMSRAHTFYGITNERIIIVSGVLYRKTVSLDLRLLNEISMTEKSNGSGTITFGRSNPFNQLFGQASWPGIRRYAPPAFDLIDNAKKVYAVIREAQQQRGR